MGRVRFPLRNQGGGGVYFRVPNFYRVSRRGEAIGLPRSWNISAWVAIAYFAAAFISSSALSITAQLRSVRLMRWIT